MPRQPRITIPGIAHHITQRGNYRLDVFDESEDFAYYSDLVNIYAGKYRLDILAYCLMNNHIHFIAVPHKDESLARAFNAVHMRYAQYINKKRKAYGHLWQGRFFSCLLDDKHLYRAIRYVECNPVRVKIVKQAWQYPYSSAKEHIGQKEGLSINLKRQKQAMNEEEWKDYLRIDDTDATEDIRLKTQRGLAMGEQPFIEKIEKKLERSLVCRNPGRPKAK